MNEIKYRLILLVRFLGVLFSLLLLEDSIRQIIFNDIDIYADRIVDSTIWDRMIGVFPFLIVSLVLLVPFKYMKRPFLYYPYLIILILTFIFLSFNFYIVWQSNEHPATYDGYIIFSMIWFLNLTNIWAFFKITSNKNEWD
jgi:hypothetical protein